MGDQQTRQANLVLPPRAGLIASYAASATAASANLALLDNQAVNLSSADTLSIGPQGCYVTLYADGGKIYIVLGASQAAVTGGNVPVIATNGVNAAGVCWPIPADTPFPVLLEAGVDLWVGFISAAAAQLRVYRSSPYPQAC
jgi:hypothetical protein